MLTSKEFDEKLRSDKFQELEEEFQHTKSFFESLNEKIVCTEVESKFPAFCWDNHILIKFPTYKIRIKNNKMSQDALQKKLVNVGNFRIYDESIYVSHTWESVQLTAIHCLEDSLDKNIEIATKIENILNQENICTERWVDCGYYPILIEKEEGYIKVIKNN